MALYLDDILELRVQVAYRDLGRRGPLGYESKIVQARGARFGKALSAHAPSTVKLALSPKVRSFSCQVALNNHIPAGSSSEISWSATLKYVDNTWTKEELISYPPVEQVIPQSAIRRRIPCRKLSSAAPSRPDLPPFA